MNSYILQSDACRHCDPTQAQPWFRRMLRTPNADICTNCGAVLQTFPTLNMTVEQGEHAPIAIPAPVTAVLEELLRRRLFSVARGYNPRQAERSFDPSRTPAHRRSDQALIELAGRANCGVTIRWNYSEVGDFIDFNDNNAVYHARYVANGTSPGAVILAGFRAPLGGDIYALTMEGRYLTGEGTLNTNDFLDTKIDLGGTSLRVGFLIRF